MPRRGLCKCGTMLLFRRTERGYKRRCPACRAVVRLRRGVEFAAPPPLPAPAADAPTDLSLLSLHETSAPLAVVELEVYREPVRRHAWLRSLGLAVGVCLAIAGGSTPSSSWID